MKTYPQVFHRANSLDNTSESVNTCYGLLAEPSCKLAGERARRALGRDDLSDEVIARFHTKYQKSSFCWLWQAGKFAKGYGMVNLGRDESGKQWTEYAHRIAYVLAKGPIPKGAVVRHSCDTPACVNPKHLKLGTQADNVNDAKVQGHYNRPHPSAQRVTDAQVRDIRESSQSGVTLAKRYGVTPSCISQIRNLRRRAA